MKPVTNNYGKLHKRLLKLIPALALIGMCIPSAQAVTYPTSYWQFDDSSNRGKDTAGGRDFSITAGTGFSSGLFGDAISFDGNAAHRAQRPVTDPVFDIPSDFTMQVWANFSTTSGEQVLLEKFDGPAGPGWTFYKGSANTLV